MRGCALRKVVRNLAHKKLENRGVEPQHLPSQIPRPAPTGWSPVGWWMAEKPGAEGSPRSPGEKTAALMLIVNKYNIQGGLIYMGVPCSCQAA